MTCCSTFCASTQRQFSPRLAARQLARYRRKGPDATTRMLRDLLTAPGPTSPTSRTLLDIGAGIGVLTFELLHAGFEHATAVDASAAFVVAGREEAARQRLVASINWFEGDFIHLAPRLPLADVVTLDRVVCCYPAYEPLLTAALERANRAVGLSYPRDRWYVRAVMALDNGVRRLRRGAFRTFVHAPAGMSALLRASGFQLVGRRTTLAWSVDVYTRMNADSQTSGGSGNGLAVSSV